MCCLKWSAATCYHTLPPAAEYCNRGSLLDAIDRGVLHLQAGAGGPNLPAIVACALEVAGEASCCVTFSLAAVQLIPSWEPART